MSKLSHGFKESADFDKELLTFEATDLKKVVGLSQRVANSFWTRIARISTGK